MIVQKLVTVVAVWGIIIGSTQVIFAAQEPFLLCYKVAEFKRFEQVDLKLKDQFSTYISAAQEPISFCVPVALNSRDGKISVDIKAKLYYVCYSTKDHPALRTAVTVSNKLGDGQVLGIEKPNELCVPSKPK